MDLIEGLGFCKIELTCVHQQRCSTISISDKGLPVTEKTYLFRVPYYGFHI